MEAEHRQELQEFSRQLHEQKQRSQELKTSMESAQTNMSFEKERVNRFYLLTCIFLMIIVGISHRMPYILAF